MVLFDSCAPLGRRPCESTVAICCGCPERKGGRGCDQGWIDGHNHDTLVTVHQKVHAQNWAAPSLTLPPAHRANGCPTLLRQVNFFLRVADHQSVALAKSVFHNL